MRFRSIPYNILDGIRVNLNGVQRHLSVPVNADMLSINAVGGDVYFAINDYTCSINSPGFLVEGGREFLAPIANLERLCLFGAAGASAHITFYVYARAKGSTGATEFLPDYYVDQVNGNDASSGRSPDDAWQTAAKVNGFAFTAGERVAFRRGQTWAEILNPTAGGADGFPLVFGAYGEGAKPNFAPAANPYTLDIGVSYVKFQDLVFQSATQWNIYCRPNNPNLTNITLLRVEAYHAQMHNLLIGGYLAGDKTPNNVTVDDCTFMYFDESGGGGSPSIYQAAGDGTGGDNLLIQRCYIGGTVPFGVDTNLSRNGIQVNNGDNIRILDNEVTAVDHGIVLVTNGVTGWEVARNFVHDTGDDGIYLYTLDDASGLVYNNVLFNISDNGIDLQLGAGDYGLIAYNTIYNPLNQAISLRGDDGMTATFRNNIFVMAVNPSPGFVHLLDVLSTVDIDDFDFDYNLYYDFNSPPVPNPFSKADSGADQMWAQWQAAGRDVNGLTVNPLFVNRGGGDADDYNIQAGSPAIGVGVAIVGITDDYRRAIRSDPPDMGAFER